MLLDRFLFKGETVKFVVYNILLLVVILVTHHYVKRELLPLILGERPVNDNRKGPSYELIFVMDTFKFTIPILISIAVKSMVRWTRIAAERKEAENMRLQSELESLRYQLQPHFFFNSLNNIYSLVDLSPIEAKKTIHALGKLMRYLLYDTKTEKVSLDREVDFLSKYIELMKLRSGENTHISYQFPKGVADVQITPLLFISLIENAFKHGISASLPSVLTFKMEVENGILKFTSFNTNYPKTDDDQSGSGVGLENLRRKLDLLYAGKHKFKTEVKEGNYIATLRITL